MTGSQAEATPFFILGSQRSGTTMLRLMLNNHPNLCVPHETGFVIPFYLKLDHYAPLENKNNLSRLIDDIAQHPHVVNGELIKDKDALLSKKPGDYATLIAEIMRSYADACGKKRWGDKTPSYTEHIDILYRLFPNAKFIHLLRDGRDVALSLQNLSWGSKCVPRLARDWAAKTVICHKVGNVLPKGSFFELKYENLVLEPQAKLKEICEFLGEDYSDEILAYSDKGKENMPKASMKWHENSIRAPNPKKLYGWKKKMPEADRIIFEEVAGETLKYFDYELESKPSTLTSKIKNLYYSTIVKW